MRVLLDMICSSLREVSGVRCSEAEVSYFE